MNQTTVLDALRYIFDVVLDDTAPEDIESERIEQALSDAGFPRKLIATAMDWLMDLAECEGLAEPSAALRMYAPEEARRLDTACRNRLLNLEQQGILSAENRERVIARLLALDIENIGVDEVEWVTLMVLQAYRAAENEFNAMEGLLFDPTGTCLH